LGHLVEFFFCVYSFVLLYAFPLMRKLQNNWGTSPGLETETDTKIINTETSLHLNLEIFWFFGILVFYLIF
jgi:hypothetical protein